MTETRVAKPARSVLLAASLLAAMLVSCRNPLRTYEDEYGPLVDERLLREADVLPLGPGEPLPDPTEEVDLERDLPGEPADDAAETVAVTIEECRASTLEHNLDLQVAMIDPAIAETVTSEEEARFESLFVARVAGSDADPSQAEVFRDLFVRPFDASAGLEVPLRSGGSASATVLNSVEESFGGLNDDRYASDLELTVIQPLLRNAGRWVNTHPIRLAALGGQIAQARTKLEVIRQIAAADRAFWLLYEAREVLDIRRSQYKLATQQLEDAQARFRGQLSAEIEVVRARAGVSRRLNSIYVAELVVRDRQRTLKRIMNRPGVDVDSDVRLVLTSEPDLVKYALDGEELIAAALRNRMELLELELRLAQDWSTIDFTKNQKLPLFTLDYTYRIHGAAGSWGRATENFAGWDAWSWRLGLNVEVPIGNEAAEARAHRAILERLQRLGTREARVQAIKAEVLSALDNLELTRQRIVNALRNELLEERNFSAEQGQYRLGLRTSTEVLFAQERWTNAQIERVSAIVDYQIAQIDLAFATGTLLGASRVDW